MTFLRRLIDHSLAVGPSAGPLPVARNANVITQSALNMYTFTFYM